MELPVYLFTGFLEAGKTRFIQESLAGESFNAPGNTVIIVCEEGVEELDPSEFNTPNVYIEYIEVYNQNNQFYKHGPHQKILLHQSEHI